MGREPNKIQELRDELQELMAEQMRGDTQTFDGLDQQAIRQQGTRLKRIGEVSADFY